MAAAGQCEYDREIEEFVLVDALGNSYFGATAGECHRQALEASRVRVDHAAHNGREAHWQDRECSCVVLPSGHIRVCAVCRAKGRK